MKKLQDINEKDCIEIAKSIFEVDPEDSDVWKFSKKEFCIVVELNYQYFGTCGRRMIIWFHQDNVFSFSVMDSIDVEDGESWTNEPFDCEALFDSIFRLGYKINK